MTSSTMEAIKRKMRTMKLEKENAFDRAGHLEQKLTEQKSVSDKQEEEISLLRKRTVRLQSHVETAEAQLQEVTEKLETTNRQLANAESEVQSLTKRARSLEEEFELTENRLLSARIKLDEAVKTADESERGRKVLESRKITDDERISQLEKELAATILLGEDSDRKYDETAMALAMIDVDLERGEARLEAAEAKILALEEELNVVGNNKKSLEISEQEAAQRQELYEEQIRKLTSQLNDAENRVVDAETMADKLQKEVSRLEEDLSVEKDKYRLVSIDVEAAFAELNGY